FDAEVAGRSLTGERDQIGGLEEPDTRDAIAGGGEGSGLRTEAEPGYGRVGLDARDFRLGCGVPHAHAARARGPQPSRVGAERAEATARRTERRDDPVREYLFHDGDAELLACHVARISAQRARPHQESGAIAAAERVPLTHVRGLPDVYEEALACPTGTTARHRDQRPTRDAHGELIARDVRGHGEALWLALALRRPQQHSVVVGRDGDGAAVGTQRGGGRATRQADLANRTAIRRLGNDELLSGSERDEASIRAEDCPFA